jgi:predicted transcriptional regulator
MAQEEVQSYIEALVAARCLKVSGGAYPTISTTDLGDRVMREQEKVALALPLNGQD